MLNNKNVWDYLGWYFYSLSGMDLLKENPRAGAALSPFIIVNSKNPFCKGIVKEIVAWAGPIHRTFSACSRPGGPWNPV